MVHDGLRSIEERGIAPDESWMQALKEASGTAFLGACPAAPRIFSYVYVLFDFLAGSETVRGSVYVW